MLKEINKAMLGVLAAGILVVLIPSALAAPQAPANRGHQGDWDHQGDWGDQDDIKTKISSSTNPSTYGQWVTFTATVSPANTTGRTPTGTVTFKQGHTILATATLNHFGRATFSTNKFPATGSAFHPISVEYADKDNFKYRSSSCLKQKIIPATLTVTADNQSRPYGTANPPLTVNYTGFVNGETLATSDVTGNPSLVTGATTNSAVGSYPIVASTGTLASINYNFVFINGTLKVTASDKIPVQNISIALLQPQPEEGVELKLSGNAVQTYVIEASTDLVHWTAIGTNMTDASGIFTFVDSDSKNYSSRFYRGVAP